MIDITKFEQLQRELSREKGNFVLFGLFLRDEAPGKWDFIVSAPWLEQGKMKALQLLVDRAKPIIGQQELLNLSRIITLNHDDPALFEILSKDRHIDKVTELKDITVAGIEISHAFIFHADEIVAEPLVA